MFEYYQLPKLIVLVLCVETKKTANLLLLFYIFPEPKGSFFMPFFQGGDAECPKISA